MTATIPLKVTKSQAKFEQARVDLLNFRNEHSGVLTEYDDMLDTYNDALVEMKAAVRDHADELEGSPIGDFSVSIPRTVDALLLVEVLGEEAEKYIETITPSPYVAVKLDVYKQAVATGILKADIVEKVEIKQSVRVSGPPECSPFSLAGKRKKRGKRG